MNILIDADGCPVVDLTLQIAKQFGVPIIILCDTSHQIEREGAQTLHDRSKTADTSLWKPRTTSNQVPAFLRRHCLRMRTPFELQNDFSVAILGLSNFFGRMPQ